LNIFSQKYSRVKIIEFHSSQKYLLLSHSPKYYKLLGQLVANIKNYTPAQMRDQYISLFMEALKVKTTVKKNVNVLQHILGFLKKKLDSGGKTNIMKAIDDYHQELVPLIVPITLLNHYANKFQIEYLKNQYYLQPHPKELMLRNHA